MIIYSQASALQPEHNQQEARQDGKTENAPGRHAVAKLHDGEEARSNQVHAAKRAGQTQQK